MVTHKRARDHAPHLQLAAEHAARDFAAAVQLLQRHNRLVRRDLEDAVGGGVDDQLAGAQVLLPQLVEDRRAGGGLVAQRAAADRLLEGIQKRAREPVRERRERAPELHAGDLPVPGGRVLSGRNLPELAIAARGHTICAAEADPVDMGKPQLHQMGNMRMARADDVTQRVRSGVAICGGIRQRADAHAVQHDENGFFIHDRSSSCSCPKARQA